MAVMALKCSELASDRNNDQILTIPDKDSALTWCNIHKTVLSIIDVEIGSNIKHKKLAVFTVLNIELLLIESIDLLHLERPILIDKPIIIQINLLLYFRWEDVIFGFGLRLFDWGFFLLDLVFVFDEFFLVYLLVIGLFDLGIVGWLV